MPFETAVREQGAELVKGVDRSSQSGHPTASAISRQRGGALACVARTSSTSKAMWR